MEGVSMTTGLGGLGRLRRVETRSISPENFDGSAGWRVAGRPRGRALSCARDLGPGWKISPSVVVEPGETFALADDRRPGPDHPPVDHHPHRQLAHARCCGPTGTAPTSRPWRCRTATSSAAAGALRPGELADRSPRTRNGGFNSYWPMPFRAVPASRSRTPPTSPSRVYYQVTYEIGEDHAEDGYLHAQWRRSRTRSSDRTSRTRSWRASRGRGTTSAPTSPGA